MKHENTNYFIAFNIAVHAKHTFCAMGKCIERIGQQTGLLDDKQREFSFCRNE